MAQRRYFDFQSHIKSKTSAESAALASGGIGVKFGFNKVSVINSNKTLSISSTKDITITNDINTIDRIKHVLITPDGIITSETTDIQVSLYNSVELVEGAYFVLASHQYINSPDTIVPTSYSLVRGSIDLMPLLTQTNATIETWYSKLSSIYSGLNRNTTIIAALVEYHSNSNVTIYTPYNNQWPQNYGSSITDDNPLSGYTYLQKTISNDYNAGTIISNVADSSKNILLDAYIILKTKDGNIYSSHTKFIIPPVSSLPTNPDSLNNSIPMNQNANIMLKINNENSIFLQIYRNQSGTMEEPTEPVAGMQSLEMWYKKIYLN